jgi:aromatic ring-opening dioxygenase catalytic subunit (LigB family)
MTTTPETLTPTYYIPHGGGPWPFMPERAAALESLTAFLRGLIADSGTTPRAIVVISGHWEESLPTVSARSDHSMYYDYYGFPEHTYHIDYPAPGSPDVAREVVDALAAAGFAAATESERGYDHGVFVPFMLADPNATIPVVPLSLVTGLDPARHLAIGRALAPLRRENVLIIGSGMSFHNLRALFAGGSLARATNFDEWLNAAVTGDPAMRDEKLTQWSSAPDARFAHPREEHLMPLMVAAGAADGEPARRVFADDVMGAATSGFRFG